MLIGAIAAVLVTDSVYGWIQLHSSYTPGGPLDGGWIAYYVLFGAAALHPSMTTVSDATAPKVNLTPTRIVGISLAALIAPVVEMLKFSARGGSDAIVIGSAAIVLFGLVIVRMIGLARAQRAAAERESVLRESVLRAESEVRLSALVKHSSDVILVLASDTAVEYVSPSIRSVLGYEADDFVGRRLLDAVPEEDRALVQSALGGLLARPTGSSEAFEFRIRHSDGRLLDSECLFTNLLEHTAVGGIVVNLRDVTERKRFEEQLTYQAFHDPVTGLANRALFRDRVEHALRRRGEQPGARRSVPGPRRLQDRSTTIRPRRRRPRASDHCRARSFCAARERHPCAAGWRRVRGSARRPHSRIGHQRDCGPATPDHQCSRLRWTTARLSVRCSIGIAVARRPATRCHRPRSTSYWATPMRRCTRQKAPTAIRSATSRPRCTKPWPSSSRYARS